MVGLGIARMPVDISLSLMMCYNESILRLKDLVEVDLSTILDLLGSNHYVVSSGYVTLVKFVPCPLPSSFSASYRHLTFEPPLYPY